jgi:hypothetical protein
MTKRTDYVTFGRGAWDEIFEEVFSDDRSAFVLLFRLTMDADYQTGEVEGSSVDIARHLGWNRRTYRKYLQQLGDEVEVIRGVNRYAKGRVRIVHYRERLGLAGYVAGHETASSGTGSVTSYNVSTSADAAQEQDLQDSVSRSVDRLLSAPAAKNAPPDAGDWERKKQRAFYEAKIEAEQKERQRREAEANEA